MNYINRETGDSVSQSVYNQLTDLAKNKFIKSEDVVNKTHTIIETRSDNLSVGDAVAVVALSPIIILKSIFG